MNYWTQNIASGPISMRHILLQSASRTLLWKPWQSQLRNRINHAASSAPHNVFKASDLCTGPRDEILTDVDQDKRIKRHRRVRSATLAVPPLPLGQGLSNQVSFHLELWFWNCSTQPLSFIYAITKSVLPSLILEDASIMICLWSKQCISSRECNSSWPQSQRSASSSFLRELRFTDCQLKPTMKQIAQTYKTGTSLCLHHVDFAVFRGALTEGCQESSMRVKAENDTCYRDMPQLWYPWACWTEPSQKLLKICNSPRIASSS